jgi:hypothetical protein
MFSIERTALLIRRITSAAVIGGALVLGWAGSASAAIVVEEYTDPLMPMIDLGNATTDGDALIAGGFRFEPYKLQQGGGDGPCVAGACLLFNTNNFTLMTTNPAGGLFDLDALVFDLEGQTSELAVLNFSIAGGELIVDIASPTPGQNSTCESISGICVEKNKWYTLLFHGAADNVTAIRFENSGAGTVRIAQIGATVVPLPAPFLLMLAGLGGLGVMSRRKAKAA